MAAPSQRKSKGSALKQKSSGENSTQPEPELSPVNVNIACTEAKETKQPASSPASTPVKSSSSLSSNKPRASGFRPNSRRGQCGKRRYTFIEGSPPKRLQKSSIKSPPSPLVPLIPCLLKSSSGTNPSSNSSPAILMKCLSSLVTEEEIKAPLLSRGLEVVSCKLYTDSEASGSDLGTKNALVHLGKHCQVSQAMKELSRLSIHGEGICMVPLPNTTFMHCQTLCMSEHRYNFFMKRFPEDVKQLQLSGGKVSYLHCKRQMVIHAPRKVVLCKFINDVGKTGEVKQYLSPDKWKSVQTDSSDGDSFFVELKAFLGSDLSVEVHPSLNEPQVLLVVGIIEQLMKAGNCLDDFLTIKHFSPVCLNIKALQMKALFCILPNLTEDTFNQYRVKVDGFHAKSTCLILRGPPAMISQARADIIAKVSSILLKQVEFPHPHILIRSVQKRLIGIRASLFSPDGEINTNAALKVSPVKPHICSLSKDSLEEADRVLKNGLFEIKVVLASCSPEVTTAVCTELQKEVPVVMKVKESSQNSTTLLVQGYVLKDVRLACRRLVVEFRVIKRSFGLSSLHITYLKTLLLDSASQQEEGELLCRTLHDLAVSVTFKSAIGINKVCLTGVSRAVESAVDQILNALCGLECRKFDYTYDLCFLEQIKQAVLNPITVQKKPVLYCVERTCNLEAAAAGGTPLTFSITIFSKNSDSFRETCEAMKAICLYSSSHSIHPDALILKRKSLNDVASKHGAKIELVSEPKPLLRIHALHERNAVSCLAEMDKFIVSAIKTTEEVRVDVYKARYIQSKYAEEIAEFGQQCDIQLPQQNHKVHSDTSLSIHIKGNIGIVSKACKRIKEVSEQCKVTKVTLQCPLQYLSMWRKRWQEFKCEQEGKLDILIEFNCQPPSCTRKGSDQPQPDCNTPVSSTFIIYGQDHEGIEATVQLLLERENGQLLTESTVELSEEKQIEILQTGLEKKEIVGPHIKHSICMNIKKGTRIVTLTAPVSWENRLSKAKDEILQFVGVQAQVENEFICDDRVVGLVLLSRSFQFCSQLEKVAKDSNISIQPFREPHPGFKLCGLKSSIELFKFKAKDLISSHVIPMIGSNQLQVSTLELSVLTLDTFRHLESKLQEELCVVYQSSIGEDEACGFECDFIDLEDTALALFPSRGKEKHWFWENDNGQFLPYPSEVSDALTAMHTQCSRGSYKWVCPENGNQYYIDLTRMEQRNTVTGVTRKVSLQSAKHHWYYLDDHGVDQPYDDVLSNQLERNFCQGIKHYDIGIYSFDLKQMVMMKPMERPMTRKTAAVLTHIPQDKKEKKPTERADTKSTSLVIRGPKKNLKQAQSRIRREIREMILTKDLNLPPHSTLNFEQNLEKIAAGRKDVSISIIAKSNGVASFTQAKVVRIKGLQQSIDEMVIKIQGEIIKFQSLKTREPHYIPPEWETQDKKVDVQLFEVQYKSSEWCQVTSLFKQTLPTVRVLSVKRIQNKLLWKKYIHHKTIVHQKNGGKVNEKELFHGTRGTDPKRIFQSEEGFDMRFSSEGLWGQANYFAVNSSYSNAYAHKRHDGEKEMLLAKVLTGVSVECEPDQTLRMPPLRSKASGGIECRYDSVCGVTKGFVVYMTYSNDKAYPAYLIRYQDNPYRTQSASQYTYASVPVLQHTGTSQPSKKKDCVIQ